LAGAGEGDARVARGNGILHVSDHVRPGDEPDVRHREELGDKGVEPGDSGRISGKPRGCEIHSEGRPVA